MSSTPSDSTAAFFAKKKKKKSFKGFNANKIDVASVTPTVHVYVIYAVCGECYALVLK